MTLRTLVFCCFIFSSNIFGQEFVVHKLDSIVIADTYLKKNSKSININELSAEKIQQNKPSLTSLLNYNSTIYFKENGLGMVSSPSFRGTTAQQTAVIWNGININSQLNGQTDFNTIATKNFNNITVRAGGGSAIYGSSAIGGSIHLNNELVFNSKISSDLQVEYGSFNTKSFFYNGSINSKNFSAQIGFSRNSSNNNYDYVRTFSWKGEQRRNLNGEFFNNNLSLNFGLKLANNQFLKLYSQTSNSNRNLSLTNESDTKSKYVEIFSRNLLEYNVNIEKVTINFKNAFISENYEYYDNIAYQGFSSGIVESYTSKLDFGYKLSTSINLNAVSEYNRAKGFGTSIDNKIREISSFLVLFSHQKNKWQNEFVIRKEITSAYNSPVLFSVGSAHKFNTLYQLKLNVSRNFRIPTFNDLYYTGGGGFGNPNLKPENAYQAEVGNVFSFKKFKFVQNIYAIKTNNLISWFPTSNGNSSPQNTNKVFAYGLESQINWHQKISKHFFDLNLNFAYTISQNEETKKQLLYVPFHKLTGSLVYKFKKIEINYKFLYNGFVFKLSDNNPKEIVKAYKVSNIGINYDFKKKFINKIGIIASNILNQKYQSVEGRYMPGINFNTFVNFNI